MKSVPFFLAVLFLVGCVRGPVPKFQARRVEDGVISAKSRYSWRKEEYAPKQYADVVYDSTGIYGHLQGMGPSEIIKLIIHISNGDQFIDYSVFFSRMELIYPERGIDSPLPNIEVKWVTRPTRPELAQLGGVFDRTFWIPWSALELDGPPKEGTLSVSVHALERTGRGANFRIGQKADR